MRFDPATYEEVKDRLARFWAAHPSGRVLTRLERATDDLSAVVIVADVYRDAEDARPAATGIAEEHRGGNGANRDCWTENCETSAIGRALANLGMHGTRERPSREEMAKVERHAPPERKPRQSYMEVCAGYEPEAIEYLVSIGWLAADQELPDLSPEHASKIESAPVRFRDAVVAYASKMLDGEE